MNRREFVSMLAGGTVPFLNDEWRSQLQKTTDQSSSSGQPSLRDFVVPEATLDDVYVPAGTERSSTKSGAKAEEDELNLQQRTVTAYTMDDGRLRRSSRERVSDDDERPQLLDYNVASKEYVIPIETEHTKMNTEARFITKAGKPANHDERTTTPRDIHRYWYHKWWGSDAEPLPEHATAWVDTHTEKHDEPHEWSEYSVRQPVLYFEPELMAAADSRRPYYEETLIIATTDWGALFLQNKMLHFGDENETIDMVRALAEELYSQAQNAPSPMIDQES